MMSITNRTANNNLMVVIPVYNEEENMLRLEEALITFKERAKVKTCILFVNDGSVDASGRLIREICNRDEDFFYLEFARDRGLSAAMKAGIDYCCSPLVGYMDADLQTTPEDFNLLLDYAEEYDMVMGIRTGRKDSFVKNLSSRMANGFRRFFTHDGVEDTGCPLKIIRTDCARQIPFFTGMHRFLPALIQLQCGKVKQILVHYYARMAGKSKYHLCNRLTGPFRDCFVYQWMRKRYIHYEVTGSNF